MRKSIEIMALLLAIVSSMCMVSCSDDEFTDKKEIIKASWRASGDGWNTLEFNGKHWNGSYHSSKTWIYLTGDYKWESDNIIRLTGTTTGGYNYTFTMEYVFGSYQTLILKGSPDGENITTQFTRVND